MDLIDTSQSYGPDIVNAFIAEPLYPYPEDLVIATKVGGTRTSRADGSGPHVRGS